MSPEPLSAFRHQVVRDLAWSVFSPSLLTLHAPHLTETDDDWLPSAHLSPAAFLSQLDHDPAELLDWLGEWPKFRIGRYYEALVCFWLTHSDFIRVLDSNLPVRHGNSTLGEFDLLLADGRTGETIHLEVAVKFYLGVGEYTKQTGWWGPGKRDCLDSKVRHLLEKQSRLSENIYARDTLAQEDIVVSQRRCLIKGRLFYPQEPVDVSFPDWANPGHLKGFWLPQSEFNFSSQHWYLLEKHEWLGPTIESQRDPARLQYYPEASNRPHCIAVLDSGENERCRAFLVADDWASTLV